MKEKTRFILFVLCSNEKPPVTNGDWITAVIETGGKIRKERKKEKKKDKREKVRKKKRKERKKERYPPCAVQYSGGKQLLAYDHRMENQCGKRSLKS